jgi:hypothetical protein
VRQRKFTAIGQRWRWLFWETLIIVLGVLIAFAVNDNWTDRQERRLELQYLKRLHSDIKSDEQWVSSYLENRITTKFAALDAIAPVVRGKEPVPENLETFLRNVGLGGAGGASPNYFVNATTFEDLKATGNLRLIRNAEVRSKLNKYYNEFENTHRRMMARRSGYFMFVHSILPAELRESYSMEVVNAFGVDHALEKILTHEFRDLLNQEYNMAYFLRHIYEFYAELSRELAAELQAHIVELESS